MNMRKEMLGLAIMQKNIGFLTLLKEKEPPV